MGMRVSIATLRYVVIRKTCNSLLCITSALSGAKLSIVPPLAQDESPSHSALWYLKFTLHVELPAVKMIASPADVQIERYRSWLSAVPHCNHSISLSGN